MITDKQLEELPHEDPEASFIKLEKLIREQVEKSIWEAEGHNLNADEYRRSYISAVLAAASEYGINDLSGYTIPRFEDAELIMYYNQFKSEAEHCVTRLRIRNASRQKKNSTALADKDKSKIHNFVQRIREIIDTAGLEEAKRNKLFERLNDFAAEVDKTRTGFQNFTNMYLEFCSALGEGIEKLEPARKWLESIAEILGKARAKEDEVLQISKNNMKAIDAPRKQLTTSYENVGMDDEIPF